jgi:hypothetical protein
MLKLGRWEVVEIPAKRFGNSGFTERKATAPVGTPWLSDVAGAN